MDDTIKPKNGYFFNALMFGNLKLDYSRAKALSDEIHYDFGAKFGRGPLGLYF